MDEPAATSDDAATWPRPTAGRGPLLVLSCAFAVFASYVLLSLAFPRTVPRLVYLPMPQEARWHEDCNDHAESWQRSGLFWRGVVVSTTVACLGDE